MTSHISKIKKLSPNTKSNLDLWCTPLTWLTLLVMNFYTNEFVKKPVTLGKLKIMNHPKLYCVISSAKNHFMGQETCRICFLAVRFGPYIRLPPDEKIKQERIETAKKEGVPNFIKYMEKILEKNGGIWLVGDKVLNYARLVNPLLTLIWWHVLPLK